VNAFKLNKDIEAQQEVIEIAEKKNKSIAKEGESLLKSKSKTESKQSQNNIEIGSLKSDMENQQKTLETIKTKTATIEQMDALKKEVSKQEDVVKKATKRYDNAINDAEYFVKELKENALEIQQNKTDQENQIAEVKKQKDILESLKAELAKIVIQ
jgi:chromosome segregation ATPase